MTSARYVRRGTDMSHIVTSAPAPAAMRAAADSGAYHEHLRRLDARYAAEQLALAAARTFEIIHALLRGHASCNLRHGDEQRQRAVRTLDGLVCAANGAAVDHCACEFLGACEVEIGKDQLASSNERILRFDRLLDLYYHLCDGIYLLDRRQYLGTGRTVIVVRESAVDTGRSLYVETVTAAGQLLCTRRSKSDAVFVVLDLLWNSNDHNVESFKICFTY